VRVVPATIVRSLGVAQRGIKTDQRDARALSEASVRIELASVHVPKKESREIKTACGMRETAVQARTQLINSVRGWLRGELERVRSGAPETFATRVRESRTSEKIPAHVERQLAIIEAITEQIKGADRDLLELAKRNERCRLLMSVPGVGPITSLRFVAAVDEFERRGDRARRTASWPVTSKRRTKYGEIRCQSIFFTPPPPIRRARKARATDRRRRGEKNGLAPYFVRRFDVSDRDGTPAARVPASRAT